MVFAATRAAARADAHRNALPDAAAERMNAETRFGETDVAIAECAVGDRHIAHPRVPVSLRPGG